MQYVNAPANTLGRWLKGSVLTTHVDRSDAKVYLTAKAIHASGLFGSEDSPDVSAATFYLLNQSMNELSKKFDLLEPLPADALVVAKAYSEECSKIAIRMFWYVLLISAREARHNKANPSSPVFPKVLEGVRAEYPALTSEQVKAMWHYTDSFPDSASSALEKLLLCPESFKLGPFCKLLSVMYYKCSWNSAFGGKKWGVIADALHSFVSGEWTAEMFADTAFTLAHNTAPIFNKGMLYCNPSGKFIELLDVQRAGMVPLWLGGDGAHLAHHVPHYEAVKAALPEMFNGMVDWMEVEQLGAVGSYKHKPSHGLSTQQPMLGTIQIDHATVLPILDYARKEAA